MKNYLADASTIANSLGGHATGRGGFLCRCPVLSHGLGRGDRNPSLSVADGDGTILVNCFGGCDSLDVLDELRRRGLYQSAPRNRECPRQRPTQPAVHTPDDNALAQWKSSKSAPGSAVETYLRRERSIGIPIPPSLRCGTARFGGAPTMVAAVQRPDGKVVAVQTTFLTNSGKKASGPTPRITTGALGNGAVRLGKVSNALGIAEGVETAAAAMEIGGVACWASLGSKRMSRVAIPDHVESLYIFADNDAPGREAAEKTAEAHHNRRVVILYPPREYNDWNDALRGHATLEMKEAA